MGVVAKGPYCVDDAGPALIASRCTGCAAVQFPAATRCSRCGSDDVASVTLPRSGRLWSFTVQGFRPKSPPYAGRESAQDFEPYGVGYVDLGSVIVEGRLTTSDADSLQIGDEMELTEVTFATDDQGAPCTTYAFRPVGAEARAT